nr:phosphatase domain-containing protein [Lysinibacter cavernae]
MPAESTRPVLLARIDDWIHVRRARRAVKRGKIPTVIPYIGYGKPDWIRVLGRVLYLKPGSTHMSGVRVDEQQASRVRGWRSFMSVHVPFLTVTVEVDGVVLGEVTTDRGGVIDAIVPATLTPGWHSVRLSVNGNEVSGCPVYVVDPAAHFGVISDVDDTVMITKLPKPFVAAWNSFVRHEQARVPTPGMAVFIDRQISSHPGAPIIYLSTGAWNVAPTLTRFLSRNLYPMGPLLLTDWGPTTDRWFRSGREHKERELRRLAAEFPEVKWLLIGDDGQHDEALYHEFSLQHPDNVAAVAIRQLTTGEAVLAGGRSKAELHTSVSGVPWVYGPDGATLARLINDLPKK